MKKETKNLCKYLLEDKRKLDKTAFFYCDQEYSYKELYTLSCLYGEYIRKRVYPGNKMIIHIVDQPKSIFLFLGAIKVGVHPIFLNRKQDIEKVMDIINEEDIQLIICDYDKINDQRFLHIDDISIEKEKIFHSFYTQENGIFSIFSSGSGGKPKLIAHSYNDVLACIESSGENVIHIEKEDIFYSQSSFAFAYGIVSGLFLPFAYGATTILNKDGNIFEIVKTVQARKPTLFFAVPVIYKNMIRMAKMNAIYFNTIRLFISAGELMPSHMIQEWENIFKKTILQGIGSTELLYLYISNTLADNKYGSLGKVLPGYFVEIRDENGRKIYEENTIGELYIHGNSLSSDVFLYDNVSNEAGTIWLKTGDLVSRDSEGFYWYKGRSLESFKINGMWVDSTKIVEIILAFDKVKEVIVTGKLSETDTTKIVAYLQIKEEMDDEDIKRIKGNISKFMGREFVPSKFYIIDEFPRNINGKIDRKKLLMKSDYKKVF